MTSPLRDLPRLLGSLEPVLQPGTWAFVTLPPETDLSRVTPLATFRESEGLTAVLPLPQAEAAGWTPAFRARWITLTVASDLEAVGLTAAFSAALAEAGLSCNVMAGVHHDHLFVPEDRGEEALACLRALQARAARNPAMLAAPLRRP